MDSFKLYLCFMGPHPSHTHRRLRSWSQLTYCPRCSSLQLTHLLSQAQSRPCLLWSLVFSRRPTRLRYSPTFLRLDLALITPQTHQSRTSLSLASNNAALCFHSLVFLYIVPFALNSWASKNAFRCQRTATQPNWLGARWGYQIPCFYWYFRKLIVFTI